MTAPPGYKVPKGQVCKLRRSLYGLRQASRQWNVELTQKLHSAGFHQSTHDHCLFIIGTLDNLVILLVYVDDILIASPSLAAINFVEAFLHKAFTIKDLGEARLFLGLEIARSPQGIYINQRKYTLDLLQDAGLLGCISTTSPMVQNQHFTTTSDTKLSDPEAYRRIIGRLLYLGFTRPDLTYATKQLSQFVSEPHKCYSDAALYILRYLKANPALGLFYPSLSTSSSAAITLEAYCDADWAACKDTRRSITSCRVFLGDSLISWKTMKQAIVSRSSAKAKYRNLSTIVCELF